MVIEREISLSLGIFGVAYLLNVCCLALGADWARIVSAGFSAVVVIASLLIIFTRHSFDATTLVSAAFGVTFAWSAYVLYFSKSLRAELEERWLQSQKIQKALGDAFERLGELRLGEAARMGNIASQANDSEPQP